MLTDVRPQALARVDKLDVARGIAGQSAITAHVTYTNSETTGHATFVGSAYGGPVVMVLETGQQVYVDEPRRFGAFGTEWVRRFYS